MVMEQKHKREVGGNVVETKWARDLCFYLRSSELQM